MEYIGNIWKDKAIMLLYNVYVSISVPIGIVTVILTASSRGHLFYYLVTFVYLF